MFEEFVRREEVCRIHFEYKPKDGTEFFLNIQHVLNKSPYESKNYPIDSNHKKCQVDFSQIGYTPFAWACDVAIPKDYSLLRELRDVLIKHGHILINAEEVENNQKLREWMREMKGW